MGNPKTQQACAVASCQQRWASGWPRAELCAVPAVCWELQHTRVVAMPCPGQHSWGWLSEVKWAWPCSPWPGVAANCWLMGQVTP